MKNLLNGINPMFFFGVAIALVILGLLTGFQHRVLHVAVVSGNVISGLLLHWWKHESGKKD
ncbi:MAG: hypothetical protein U9P42_05545 [Candidatus Fermentibacteria bacterium]|nr:hypothetical protein [Candidatus Fermentibacteria bacterium]